jgi:hypothetical protein
VVYCHLQGYMLRHSETDTPYLQSIRSCMQILVVWDGKIYIGYKLFQLQVKIHRLSEHFTPHMNLLVWETLHNVQPLCNEPPHQCSVSSSSKWQWSAVNVSARYNASHKFCLLILFYYHSILGSIFMFWNLESKRISDKELHCAGQIWGCCITDMWGQGSFRHGPTGSIVMMDM